LTGSRGKNATRAAALAAAALFAAAALPVGGAAAQADGAAALAVPRVVVEMPAPQREPAGEPPAATAILPHPAPAEPPPAGAAEPDSGRPAGFDIADPQAASLGLPARTTAEADAETRTDGESPAWRRHARPFDDPAGRPRIAVVVAGLGLSQAFTDTAIERLPGEVALAISPHAADPAGVAAAARADGHEVVLALPMEPLAYPEDDPGPNTLLTSLPPRQNLGRLDALLSAAEGYVGTISEMGARFTASPEAMRPVLRRLNEAGLLFVERRTAERSAAGGVGREVGLPFLQSDRILDAGLAPELVDLRLVELEHLARDRGHAVAIVEPTPYLIERLAGWADGLPGKGFVLAPITAVAATEPAL
jgi:hypothetical protein